MQLCPGANCSLCLSLLQQLVRLLEAWAALRAAQGFNPCVLNFRHLTRALVAAASSLSAEEVSGMLPTLVLFLKSTTTAAGGSCYCCVLAQGRARVPVASKALIHL